MAKPYKVWVVDDDPDLREMLEQMFGEREHVTPQEQAEKDAAAARAWNRQFAAIGKAQEAAKAAGA
jgi:DNA-binding NtrC family response regulator